MKGKRCIKTVVAIFLLFCGLCMCKLPVEAASAAQKEAFRAELEDMLYSADATVHNVYQYRLTVSEFKKIYDEMKNGDCRLIIASYYSNMYVDYSTKLIWVDTIQIMNVDSDVLPRYQRLKNNVEEIMSGIEPGMTALDKIIYLHDEIVDLTTYKKVGYQSYGACGVLGDKVAVCAGYTKAYNLLLKMEGIETYFADGDGINHGWTYVNVDGEWYHADTTWDDTRSAVTGVPSHQFLLRNDAEFLAGGTNSHVGWKTDELPTNSTSTRFTNWYVHDITGKMSYEAGYWYYVDTANNDILCADALGKEFKLVLDGANLAKLTLVDVENGVITYKVGNTTVRESLNNVGQGNATNNPEIVEPENPGVEIVPEETPVSIYNFNDINAWREGQYSVADGNYTSAMGYICTKQIVSCTPGAVLQVGMKDARFHGVVNEYTVDGQFICATDVVDGDEITVSSQCAYVGVSIYFPNWKTITFEDYAVKFTYNLMTFELTQVGVFDDAAPEENVPDVQEPEGTVPEGSEPETEEPEVETPDETVTVTPATGELGAYNFNDISIWREGRYSATDGSFMPAAGYIATKEVISCPGGALLQIAMKDTRFHAVINEYASEGGFIKATDVVDGNEMKLSETCSYVGVSIYFPGWSAITFDEYTKKFNYSLMTFDVTVSRDENIQTVPETDTLGDITQVDLNDIAQWKSGGYDGVTGIFSELEGYIGTRKLIGVSNHGSYVITMKDNRFRTVICEYNAEGVFIGSVELADGALWTPEAETRYIAVSMYFPNWKAITFSEYTKKFTYDLMSLEITTK